MCIVQLLYQNIQNFNKRNNKNNLTNLSYMIFLLNIELKKVYQLITIKKIKNTTNEQKENDLIYHIKTSCLIIDLFFLAINEELLTDSSDKDIEDTMFIFYELYDILNLCLSKLQNQTYKEFCDFAKTNNDFKKKIL
ncbi:hypothetical protein AB837_00050 [bacterium AB1]|nr:hypothetical protein AB837_00050 [bacterium AB1]